MRNNQVNVVSVAVSVDDTREGSISCLVRVLIFVCHVDVEACAYVHTATYAPVRVTTHHTGGIS